MFDEDSGAVEDEHEPQVPDPRDAEIRLLREQLSAIATNPDGGVWTWPDLSHDAVYVSESLRPILGIPDVKEVVTSEEAFALVHPEDIGRVRGKIEERLASGGVFSVEYRLVAGGRTHFARTYGDVTTYPDRAPSVVGSTAVIDRERRLERDRRRNRRSLRRVMRAGGVYLWEWPAIWSSPVTVAGTDRAALSPRASDLDDPWPDYVHPADLPRFREAWAEATETPGEVEVEARMRLGEGPESADGAYRWYLCRGRSERLNPGQLRAEGTLVDIDERRRLEDAAKESARRLELVMTGIRAGTWEWPDTATTAMRFSDEFLALLEYDRGDLAEDLGAIWEIVDPEARPGLETKIADMFATGHPYEAEYRTRCKRSGWRWVRVTAGIELDAHGPGRHRVAGALTDVHERRTAELRLASANKQFQEFSYSVAHDLGAPVRHMRAFATILDEDHRECLDEDGAALTASIRDSGQRLEAMIDELLEYARTGIVELAPTRVALGELVTRARTQLSGEGHGRAIRWEIDALPSVHADASQIEKVFQNLLSNAIKFTAHEGEPVIRVYSRGGGDDADEVAVVVEDNGAGFDPADAHRIFGAFERAHGRAEFPGTGIGLANVARIVERHGGRIAAEGAVGQFARFTVTLPRARQ